MNFNISGISYSVEELSDLIEKYDLLGRVYYHKGLINVDTNLSEDKKKQIIIHELLHAMLNEAGYTDQKDMEELVERLSIVLYQFIKYNDLNYFKEA